MKTALAHAIQAPIGRKRTNRRPSRKNQSQPRPAAAPTLPECPSFGIDVLVGPALYLGDEVMVGLDRDDNRAVAYDPISCELVESLPIPD